MGQPNRRETQQDRLMPYAIRKTPTGWAKVKVFPGQESIVSHHKTREDAIAAIRAYYANKRKLQTRMSK